MNDDLESRVGHRQSLSVLLVLSLLLFSHWAQAANPFAEHVRSTPPQSPEVQQGTFQLPPGFEIQLVAHEPDIHKPLNLAFDTRGRLWVTTSREYPFPVPVDQPGRDRVMIFENFDAQGKAQKVTEFAGGLNIPIGVYPFLSPNPEGKPTWKAVVWSIPNIWLFEDTDDDGQADRKESLYGPFDHTRDTHGNQSSFRRGFDGWLYATHGFNNHSKVRGQDGHEVDMHSGNTYRMRLNGSRLEHHTWGQVNPFGMAWDPLGNLYSSDCHSLPIYQLLAGGYYPSFGKPHDGLGFAPSLMRHSHDSTAIDGVFYYADDLWPREFHDNVFVGNVMTSRVNRDRLIHQGSSPQAEELEDFLKTKDPWFRPVDQRLGPDGALYIADFYNRIIGHYEVPLKHPGRDRERGRIWRVVYKDKPLRSLGLPNDLDGLIGELASPSLSRRMLALQEITDVHGSMAIPALQIAYLEPANDFQKVHALWALDRLHHLSNALLMEASGHPSRIVRVHVMRVIAERGRASLTQGANELRQNGLNRTLIQIARRGLKDTDPLVQRVAAEALGIVPVTSRLPDLLESLHQVPEQDSHLRYVVRQALRNHLRQPDIMVDVKSKAWPEADVRALADVALAVNSAPAAEFLIRHQATLARDESFYQRALEHAARYAPPEALEPLAESIQAQTLLPLGFQMSLFQSVEKGLQQRGAALTPAIKSWGQHLAATVLETTESSGWISHPLPNQANRTDPWSFGERPQADGGSARLLSSFPLGEKLTGQLRSPEFVLPSQLSFYMSGHDGYPDKPSQGKNHVRLYDDQGHQLAESRPPRNDVSQKVTWDLREHEGKRGYLVITDGDSAAAYAWLAVGRFEPPVLSLPKDPPGQATERLVRSLNLFQQLGFPETRQVGPSRGDWLNLIHRHIRLPGDDRVRTAAIGALAAQASAAETGFMLEPLLVNGNESMAVREAAGKAVAKLDPARVIKAMKTTPQRLEVSWASALTATPKGSSELLQAIEQGHVTPQLLLEPKIQDNLLAAKVNDARERIAKLTKNLTPPDEASREKIADLEKAYQSGQGNPDPGRAVFEKNCGICHQIQGVGGRVGPQLDGIGHRGLARILEDIVDPNRNVDVAFRSTVLVLKDEEVVSGLFLREEGALLVLAEATGKEISIPKAQVATRQFSDTSLMPGNLGDLIPPESMNDLLAFLLEQSN